MHHVPYVQGSSKPNESTDTWDTIDWLVKNVPNNGRVGQYGISWAGWEVSMGMIDAHPALKASSPQAPPQDQFFGDDYHVPLVCKRARSISTRGRRADGGGRRRRVFGRVLPGLL